MMTDEKWEELRQEEEMAYFRADLLLLLEVVALGRVATEICSEVRHVLGLGEFGHLCVVHHGFNLLSLPSDGNGVSGVVRIPLQIIPKGVLSFRTKWYAGFSNTPLLSCVFVAFRVGVWNSALCEILLLLNRCMNPLQIATVFPQVRSLKL